MPRPRLAPGVDVFDVPGRPTAVRTPDGEFLHVDAEPGAVARLLAELDGTAGARPGGPAAADEEARRLLTAFADAGYLDPPAVWPAERAGVLLLGDAELTGPLAGLLSAAGARPRAGTPEEVAALAAGRLRGGPATGGVSVTAPTAAPVAAVVWCLDRPVPAGLWDAADRLPARGIAWARSHREGLQAWVEPLAAGAGDVLARHVRARRLAATPAHRELAAYWGAASATGPCPGGTAAGAAFVAALLATDLTAWATAGVRTGRSPGGAGLPASRRLRRLDLRDLSVSEHPVLPVPAVAPLPTAPEGAPGAVPAPARPAGPARIA
ncbi:hypothetical protein DMB38_31010 [Streptomyces sp. WAC 06738]|uniref:hypothetical protein n=1 Tax=Streptomyces sp. WAC 06738 TaxID=2203210 RepID=UPI000F71ED20|nr:hypothetical protein [Streptomyces sp. WAC 06738]AZM51087.1 hypothetical protein DMB38_31010 [Streptomyces sp. WAC 06738]